MITGSEIQNLPLNGRKFLELAKLEPGVQPPTRISGNATEVQVGAKGLDHHGQGLIFVDDDAPCYVRVVGPDAGRRLELAKLIAKNLTFENAPMTPRPSR